MRYNNFKSIFIIVIFYSFLALLLLTNSKTNNNRNSGFVLLNEEILNQTKQLKLILRCFDKPFKLETIQDGSFWILKNYIRADHGELNCAESITYTTHGDLTFLDNLKELLPRWKAPVSFAMYAPGSDFIKTLETIQYVRNCFNESDLIQYYVTFHIFFPKDHMPKFIPLTEIDAFKLAFNCSLPPPYEKYVMYKKSHNLTYPINVGRNIARKAALTHFILANDNELYPNQGFVDEFLKMIIRNSSVLNGKRPRVFPLAPFEIKKDATIPKTKTELQKLLRTKNAFPFHQKICSYCHNFPNMTEWLAAKETDELDIFVVGQRTSKQIANWEPFYVSDNNEPFFDERVTWEGQKDKRIQSFAMCLLDYEFHVLNNAFLIHRPGIKVKKTNKDLKKLVDQMNKLIQTKIVPEYKLLYGNRAGCIP